MASTTSLIGEFEALMVEMRLNAVKTAIINTISKYVGLFGLSWATVVVLGGFAQYLHAVDFGIIGMLFLLLTGRYAPFPSFSRHLFPHLATEDQLSPPSNSSSSSSRPPKSSSSSDPQLMNIHIRGGDMWNFLSATIVILLSIFRFSMPSIPTLKFVQAHYYHASGDHNIIVWLYIFYGLVTLASVLVIATVGLRFKYMIWGVRRFEFEQRSLVVDYYEHVYRKAMGFEIASPNEYTVLDFAFDRLRSELKRGKQALLVEAQNKTLVEYIYNVPTGIEMAYQHLENSVDLYEQLVAVNLARFWAREPRIEKQKLGRPERLGEAACYAIERLADKWADFLPTLPSDPALQAAAQRLVQQIRVDAHDHDMTTNRVDEPHSEQQQRTTHISNNVNFRFDNSPSNQTDDTNPLPRSRRSPSRYPFLEAKLVDGAASGNNNNNNIVDLLVDLVLNPLRPSLIYQLRALESCCRNKDVLGWISGALYKDELCKKLLNVLEESRTLQRTKIYAASALFHILLFSMDATTTEDYAISLSTQLSQIEPAAPAHQQQQQQQLYVLIKEKKLLDMLCNHLQVAPYDWKTKPY